LFWIILTYSLVWPFLKQVISTYQDQIKVGSISRSTASSSVETNSTVYPWLSKESGYKRWLDREVTEQLPVDLLRPFPADEIEVFEVVKRSATFAITLPTS
jgi:hypothetical protein